MSQVELNTPTTSEYNSFMTLLASFLFLECIDALETEKVRFRFSVKSHANALRKELVKICETGFETTCGKDDETLNQLMSSISNISKLVVKANPNHLPVIENIITGYLENPEEVLNALEIIVKQKA